MLAQLAANMTLLNQQRATAKASLRGCEAALAALHAGVESSVPVGDYRLRYGRHEGCWCLTVSHPTVPEIPQDTILRVMLDGFPALLDQLVVDCDALVVRMHRAVTLASEIADAMMSARN